MGNSLLDILVFGRRAGIAASEHAKKVKLGKLSLDHVKKFEAEMDKAEIKDPPIGPMILPDYTPEEVKGRQWNSPAI